MNNFSAFLVMVRKTHLTTFTENNFTILIHGKLIKIPKPNIKLVHGAIKSLIIDKSLKLLFFDELYVYDRHVKNQWYFR